MSMEMRELYHNLIVKSAETNKNIVVLDSDLSNSSKSWMFAEKFPDRFVNVGIGEANMIGAAAGLAAMGKIPFTHTFAPFASRRVADQVTLSVAYTGMNVKMMGSDPGILGETNGGTHMAFEDVAIMRAIPGMTVIEPVDNVQLESLFPQMLAHDGAVYTRLFRKVPPEIFEKGTKFTIGKGHLCRKGADVTIVASGIMMTEALLAGDALAKEGISAEIINIHTLKPLDTDIIIESAKKTGCVIIAENHNIVNGLGSAVCEALAENYPVPARRIGVKDKFGEVGKLDYLKKIMEMRAEDIVATAKDIIKRKR